MIPRRHLATVFQGLLMGRPEQINSGEKLAHMWLHESERVYGDRLVSPEDLKKYNDLAQGQARKIFSQFPVDKFYAKENADPLVFCHFCEDIEEHTYDQVQGVDKMLAVLENALEQYNESNAVMDLVLFEDAMKHIARISRADSEQEMSFNLTSGRWRLRETTSTPSMRQFRDAVVPTQVSC